MKFVVILTCLIVAASVHATSEHETTETTVNDEDFDKLVSPGEPEIHVDDNGHFRLRLFDEDGAMLEEEGVFLTDEKTGEEVVITKKGTYSYRGEDGKLARLAYDIDDPVNSDNQ